MSSLLLDFSEFLLPAAPFPPTGRAEVFLLTKNSLLLAFLPELSPLLDSRRTAWVWGWGKVELTPGSPPGSLSPPNQKPQKLQETFSP